MNYEVECPFCRHTNDVPVDWIKKNGRIFCPACCKSFDISIKEEYNEEDDDKVINTDGEGYW